jgi:hypothetical protein
VTAPKPRSERSPLISKTLFFVAIWGAVTVVLAYVIGRGTVFGMVAVFAVSGIGQRFWARWHTRRHSLPL